MGISSVLKQLILVFRTALWGCCATSPVVHIGMSTLLLPGSVKHFEPLAIIYLVYSRKTLEISILKADFIQVVHSPSRFELERIPQLGVAVSHVPCSTTLI